MRKTEAATQTSGISYPSAKDLDLVMAQNKKLLEAQEFQELRPVLTSASPGKGYWQQQLDHVCAHIKAFATNHPDFRLSIGNQHISHRILSIFFLSLQVTLQWVKW